MQGGNYADWFGNVVIRLLFDLRPVKGCLIVVFLVRISLKFHDEQSNKSINLLNVIVDIYFSIAFVLDFLFGHL